MNTTALRSPKLAPRNDALPRASALLAAVAHRLRRIGPLGAIILLHIALFYALQSGLIRQAAEALPREIVATFITPTPPAPPAPPEAPPAAPKTVPVVPKAVTPPKPPVKVVKKAPAPAPAPPEPTAPVAEVAPAPQAISTAPSAPVEPSPREAESAPAPVAAAPAAPATITSGIEYVQAPQPQYPSISRRMGEEGKAILRVLVNTKGRPESVEIQKTSGSTRLDEAARQAVLRAVFKPFIDGGKAVAAYAIVPINFQLAN